MVPAIALIVNEKGGALERTKVELDTLRPKEVLVKLKATGICHTDLAVKAGHIPMPFPVVLGHEGAGVVLEVGADVTEIQRGDHVVLSYNYCGSCYSCKRGRMWHCTNIFQCNFGGKREDGSLMMQSSSGSVHSNFFGQSSFCSPAIVQASSCVKVDPRLPLEIVCAMGCGFQTGAGAVFNAIKPVENKTRSLAVFGTGGVGFAAIMAALSLAKENQNILQKIIAVDINNSRLELARQLGTTHTINSATEDLAARIHEITDGEGLDAAIDCSGVVPVITQMINLLGPGGQAVSVGAPPPGKTVEVDTFKLLVTAKTYQGCHQGNANSKEFIPYLATLYSEGKLPLEKLQKSYAIGDYATAFDDMINGVVIKPILIWD
ncbi:alcohol dehydrogenase [Aureobasidium pullulans]|uniref:Alcohol dehydrogenase n=1 Tax=Aureobasidium pullulans TaxID=5580 RepID=A0A4S9Q7D5_AURPU|nr:alcohol dehydrogenase [Aureobasidium pullulans]THZ45072.1 alcohol dehydrogenase [Aureobasidium pullulans]THZ67368.1 alcohol dehydrogenase [Aureobasidium pullulans]